MSFQTHKSFVRLQNTIKDILEENQEACDCPIDCHLSNTVKAQKSMKDIEKIVHLPSVVQSEFHEAMRMLFVCKENKNNLLCISIAPFWRVSAGRKLRTLFCQPLRTDMLFSFKIKV